MQNHLKIKMMASKTLYEKIWPSYRPFFMQVKQKNTGKKMKIGDLNHAKGT